MIVTQTYYAICLSVYTDENYRVAREWIVIQPNESLWIVPGTVQP